MFDEAVYCSMAKYVDGCVSLLWQQDGGPGISVGTAPEHAVGNNDFIYDCVDKNLVLGINETLTPAVAVSVYPNPAHNNVMLNYTVKQPLEITIEIRNIMGQVVDTYVKFAENAGTVSVNVDVTEYSNGVYTVNTILGKDVFSTKFVKN